MRNAGKTHYFDFFVAALLITKMNANGIASSAVKWNIQQHNRCKGRAVDLLSIHFQMEMREVLDRTKEVLVQNGEGIPNNVNRLIEKQEWKAFSQVVEGRKNNSIHTKTHVIVKRSLLSRRSGEEPTVQWKDFRFGDKGVQFRQRKILVIASKDGYLNERTIKCLGEVISCSVWV